MTKEATREDLINTLEKYTGLSKADIGRIDHWLSLGIVEVTEDAHRLSVEIRKVFTHVDKGEETVELHKVYSALCNQAKS